MNPFRFLTRVFIDVFGITRPTPRQERLAMWVICAMLGLLAAAAIAFFVAAHSLSRH